MMENCHHTHTEAKQNHVAVLYPSANRGNSFIEPLLSVFTSWIKLAKRDEGARGAIVIQSP